VQADIDYSDVLVNGCAPDEWLALIKDAECICTDSYHGMIFSIIFVCRIAEIKFYDIFNCIFTNRDIA
uniref:polysaccharide pyruvyl transferase family protein n=1 Tax=uncultured Muribaculum sp. TaxID=1918613 RepID=UPI0025B72C4A